MAESDGIEFLDEDADIVQQCVQAVQVQYVPAPVEEKQAPLLIERRPAERRRKRKKDEEDSDYDPRQDLVPPGRGAVTHQRGRKRKQVIHKKTYDQVGRPRLGRRPKNFYVKDIVLDRKKCDIRIPDYDDPLCLPVKAIKQEESDVKRLNNWNNVCLEHFKHCDNLLKPERGETNSSTRTVVFRNVVNKQTGKSETTIWSKTCVENEDGDRKSEIFQCVLPRYKEKKVLTTFGLGARKPRSFHMSEEVILSKEDSKEGEVLVVYKPQDHVSAVYQLVNGLEKKENKEDSEDKDEEDVKMYMKELFFCKMCVPCFQTSWRGVKNESKKAISCPICYRSSFVTVYNLLAHFKTHSSEDIKKFKCVIADILAEVVEYHYKCRICREQFSAIKTLREHITTHQGTEPFMCEVGSHVTK
ncbi:uncharacterized protein LOC142983225 [Anticarsia gemmatalis]|uniref:uncharacterized protein LOC142983225 n=1 Tax=Anticarsia gemmatalis TaxID=129554 RepID=UPI003F75A374